MRLMASWQGGACDVGVRAAALILAEQRVEGDLSVCRAFIGLGAEESAAVVARQLARDAEALEREREAFGAVLDAREIA